MEKSYQKQNQRTLLPQQQQKQEYYSEHVDCRNRTDQAKPQSKVQGGLLVNKEVNYDELMKLAATAISLNVRLRSSSNMPHHMQDRALRRTRSLIDDSAAADAAKAMSSKPRPNPTHLARALKKEFDSLYGPAWHCVVGKSFGSFVTHSPGGFLYFSIDDSLSVLLFKTEVQLVDEEQLQKPAN